MLTKEYARALPGETPCTCGRSPQIQHCPRCGSVSFHGVMKKSVRNVLNTDTNHIERLEFPSFKCRRCGHPYDDYDWRNDCHAPQPRETADRVIAANIKINEGVRNVMTMWRDEKDPIKKAALFNEAFSKANPDLKKDDNEDGGC